jgi:hypothetical protein
MFEISKNSDNARPNVEGDYVGGNKVGGDYAGGNIDKRTITASGNDIVIGDNNKVTTTIQSIDPEFKNSILEFQNLLNEQLKTIQIPDEEKKSLQDNIEKLAENAKDVHPDQVISDEEKKKGITQTMKELAYKLVEISPEVAESIANLTPLAPFSKSIGKGISYFKDIIKHKLTEP